MRFQNVALESLAYALPDEVVSSDALESRLEPLYERLKLPKGRLELMTGIRERRFWSEAIKPSEASALAGKAVLEKSQFGPKDIDCIVHAAVCRDHLEPATAASVHGLLGLGENAQIFDVSNACLGFLNAMVLCASMIEQGHIKTAMVVSGEDGRPLVEHTIKELLAKNLDRKAIKPYFANLTIGSGAVAAVLCHESLLERHAPALVAATVKTDTDARFLCQGGAVGESSLQMQTDSEALLEAGVRLAGKNWISFKQETGWADDTANCFICHQVGRQHQNLLYERLSIDSSKDFSTFSYLGNIGSASVPITLAHACEANAIHPGDSVALLGIGSGLSSIMFALEW